MTAMDICQPGFKSDSALAVGLFFFKQTNKNAHLHDILFQSVGSQAHSQTIIVNHIVVSLMLTMLTNLYCECSECDIQLEKH